MRILLCPCSAIDEWNALFQERSELCHSGLMFAVFDCLQPVPDWANWMVVQPSGGVVVCALPPLEVGSGWCFVGKAEEWGCVESGEGWRYSLETIDPATTTLPDATRVRQHCIRSYRRLLPDTTVAVTMDASGAVQAWADKPVVGGQKWISSGERQAAKLGVHAHPEGLDWKALLYVHGEACGITQGTLQ